MQISKIGDFEIKQWAVDYKRYIDFQVKHLPKFAETHDPKEFYTFEEFLAGDISRIHNPLVERMLREQQRIADEIMLCEKSRWDFLQK